MKGRAPLVTVALLTVGRTPPAVAQATPPQPSAGTAIVAAGPDYDAGPFTQALFGSGWRSVWTAPARVTVFDIARFGGGVRPTETGGGNQTVSLRFREQDGWREYHFRSVDKDPVTRAMPAAVRGTQLGDIVQDLTSGLFPAAGLMVPPLLEAVGVLHVTPALFVMPDDPRLGEFRRQFAGMLGTVELSPQEAPEKAPGFAGSREIENAEAFLKLVRESRGHRLDEREFFAARLVDFVINDNDRSPDNIRFARYGESAPHHWRPIPRDRDRAFTDARGWAIKYLVRPFYPKAVPFDSRFSLAGLTFESSDLDRRLLQRITRADADQIALRVQAALDNAILDRAVAQLPAEWQQRSGERLRSTLRARRDRLPAMAREFYEWLATDVDIHGTDDEEVALITRHDDGSVTVAVRGADDPAASPAFSQRTFLPMETGEVRVYLHAGDDKAVVKGSSSGAITVRVIGGGGDDVLADSAGAGGARFYDASGKNEFITRGGTRINVQEWDAPRQGAGIRLDAPWRPDWGSSFGWGPAFDYVSGAGLIAGFGPRYSAQGFRRLPHRVEASASVLLGLGSLRPGVSLDVDYRGENSPLALAFLARATRFEKFRFHGYGNDVAEVDKRLSQVEQDVVSVEPSLTWHIGWRTREDLPDGFSEGQTFPGLRPLIGKLEAGPLFLWNKLDQPAGSPVSDSGLTGSESYARSGVRLGLSLDLTSSGPVSDRGWTASAELAGFPPWWDVGSSFGTAAMVVAGYVPLPGNGTHLAVRAGGEIASGAFPVLHAPAVGGRRTLRGFESQRYRGESSAYGSAEVRLPVGTVPFLVKWDTGVFGLADAARVWLNGRSPGGWHAGFGGGLWFTSLGQTFSFSWAHGEEHRFYVQRGMSF